MTQFSIVLVSQDNRKLITSLLRSLMNYGHLEGEVLLIDNASTDGTPEEACATGVNNLALSVIKRKERRPLPENRNLGAKLSQSDILIFCDSDVIFEDPNFFEGLERDFATYKPDIVCPLILDVGSDRVQSAGFIHWGLGYNFKAPFGGVSKQSVPPFIFRVDMLHGACFAISRKAFERLDGFDELMAPYNYDEMDLAIRARKSGMSLIADTGIYVRHVGAGTTGRIKKKLKGYWFVRHMFRSMIKNEGKRAYLMIPIYILVSTYGAIVGGYGGPELVLKAVSWALKNRGHPLMISKILDYEVVCKK